jgi:hypothetical protein
MMVGDGFWGTATSPMLSGQDIALRPFLALSAANEEPAGYIQASAVKRASTNAIETRLTRTAALISAFACARTDIMEGVESMEVARCDAVGGLHAFVGGRSEGPTARAHARAKALQERPLASSVAAVPTWAQAQR